MSKQPKRLKGFDLTSVFDKNIRMRQRGNRRLATKPGKIKAQMEREFQKELKVIRATPAPVLEPEKVLPKSSLFKSPTQPVSESIVDKLKERLHFHRGGQRKA